MMGLKTFMSSASQPYEELTEFADLSTAMQSDSTYGFISWDRQDQSTESPYWLTSGHRNDDKILVDPLTGSIITNTGRAIDAGTLVISPSPQATDRYKGFIADISLIDSIDARIKEHQLITHHLRGETRKSLKELEEVLEDL